MNKETQNKNVAYCFIDASNLFYGGEKQLGWKIDYQKLYDFLQNKYNAKKIFYYGGIDTEGFEYEFVSNKDFPIEELSKYLENKLVENKSTLSDAEVILLQRYIDRAKFYVKLKEFGYILKVKPVKTLKTIEGKIKKKANCDVDLTFDSMRLANEFNHYMLLSGDGDFMVLLQYFREHNKDITIVSNPDRTAREIKKQFEKSYRSINELKQSIQMR